MTSSLVGSEMCIRDRMSVSNVGVVSRDVVALPASPFLRSRLILVTIVSVSYTHLTLPTICSV
eukprot:9288225-Prorocentrum_lima.AAC.1